MMLRAFNCIILFVVLSDGTQADPESILIPRRFRRHHTTTIRGTRKLHKTTDGTPTKNVPRTKKNDCTDNDSGRVRKKKCSRDFDDEEETVFEGQDGSSVEVNDQLQVEGDVELTDFFLGSATGKHEVFNNEHVVKSIDEASKADIFQVNNGTLDDFNGSTRL
jgi:hypothetical protein